MCNRFVIRRLDDSDKVAEAEHRILTDNFAAKISDFRVHLAQAIGVAVQCPAFPSGVSVLSNIYVGIALLLYWLLDGLASSRGPCLNLCARIR
jgi:hypothetical protein